MTKKELVKIIEDNFTKVKGFLHQSNEKVKIIVLALMLTSWFYFLMKYITNL